MPVLIYGAYGFTGRLITEACLARGIEVIVAGRKADRVAVLAGRYGVPYRVFSVEPPRTMNRVLEEVDVVLNTAGPFVRTAPSMVEGCLHAGTHYLDITGELEVFEHLEQLDATLVESEVMAVPGVGFDVLTSDCLAAHLAGEMPEARLLELAVVGSGAVSRGTALTSLEQLGRPSYIRQEGRLVPVPPAWQIREVDLGHRRREVVSVPLGDILTAYRHTGIPNITGYAALPALAKYVLLMSRQMEWFFQLPVVRSLLRLWIEAYYTGPSDKQLEAGRSYVWGRVEGREGREHTAVLALPETYAFTAEAAAICVEKVLSGTVKPGFQTPVTAFGSDVVLEVEGAQLLEF